MEKVGNVVIGQEPIKFVGVTEVVIPATTGKQPLLSYGFSFSTEEGPPLSEWGAAAIEGPTPEMKAVIFDVQSNASIARIYAAFSGDPSRWCLTRNQIGEFLSRNPSLVRHGAPFFLLFRNNGGFFVAKALLDGEDRIAIHIIRFTDERGWLGRNGIRVIIPG